LIEGHAPPKQRASLFWKDHSRGGPDNKNQNLWQTEKYRNFRPACAAFDPLIGGGATKHSISTPTDNQSARKKRGEI
jgi:hypothetical protein